nr:sodium/glucose cotransporter 2-like [Oryctolagus cuniculus]
MSSAPGLTFRTGRRCGEARGQKGPAHGHEGSRCRAGPPPAWRTSLVPGARCRTSRRHPRAAPEARFFVIILFAVTIVWVPIMNTLQSETLYEYKQAVRSYLTPPITAIFLLAIFCKRVNEKDEKQRSSTHWSPGPR